MKRKMYEYIIPKEIKKVAFFSNAKEFYLVEADESLPGWDQKCSDLPIVENNPKAITEFLLKEIEELDRFIVKSNFDPATYPNLIVAHRDVGENKKEMVLFGSFLTTPRSISWLE